MTTRFFHPVIAARRHLPGIARARDIILTIALWWVYIYFMKDLFFFFIDVARWGWNGFTNGQDYKSFEILPTLLSYVEAMVAFVVVYIGWARYNLVRFRGKSRRKAAPPVHPKDLAKFYGQEEWQVAKWQHAKIMTIHHDIRGNIVEVDTRGNV